jgi:prepilin-type N-terminal cleavage/methylation domain-containing protein
MAPSARSTGGFTLVEIMIALVIMSVVLLGMAASTAVLVHNSTGQRNRTQLIETADARIDEIVASPDYDGLETQFAGTTRDIPLPGIVQVTTIRHVTDQVGRNGGFQDFKVVTVTVTATGVIGTVQRTITVAHE